MKSITTIYNNIVKYIIKLDNLILRVGKAIL